MELEDDLFFADLSKQISLLIMDDDEDPVASYPSVSLQGLSTGNYPATASPYMYEQICTRQSKGTGVFIPRSSHPRRKHRQGRHNSFDNKSSHRKHLDNNNTRSTVSSQVSYSNSFNSKKG